MSNGGFSSSLERGKRWVDRGSGWARLIRPGGGKLVTGGREGRGGGGMAPPC